MAYCSKPNCRHPASVVLAYNYGNRLVVLEDCPDGRLPAQTYALCPVCADGFQPPKGWSLEDRRERPHLYASLTSPKNLIPARGSDAHERVRGAAAQAGN